MEDGADGKIVHGKRGNVDEGKLLETRREKK